MHAIIRHYTLKSGTLDRNTINDMKRQTEAEYTPMLEKIRGFHSFYLVNVNDRELVSVSVFEDRNALAESTRRAAEFVKTLPVGDQMGSPEIIEGELLVSREAPVGAR